MVYQRHESGRDKHLRDAQAVIAHEGAAVAAVIVEDHPVVRVEVCKRGARAGDRRAHKGRPGAELILENAEHQIEYQKVDDRGAERAYQKLEHHLEDAPRVLDRVVVRAVIFAVVHCVDALLNKANAHALHVQQHVRLVFKALTVDAAERVEIAARYRAQAGLCVGQLDAVAQAEEE